MAERQLTFQEAIVLSMYVNEEGDSEYRIQVDDRVRYISVKPKVYDYADILCFPPLLIDNLHSFPLGDWITKAVGRDDSGSLTRSISFKPLAAMTSLWHPKQIDILSLKRVGPFNICTNQVEWEGDKTAVAKIARFQFATPQVEQETRVYHALSTMRMTTKPWAPAILGHFVENTKVMGLLIQKTEGRRAGIEDYGACQGVVSRFHESGFVYGDLSRYNFLVDERVDEEKVRVTLVDFENAAVYDEVAARKELENLRELLKEETGRGGPAVPM